MPRANRYWVAGAAYHLTHRCHNREFLFKRAQERDGYRELLRQELRESSVSLLNYTITSNHVHLLVTAEAHASVAALMQRVQGRFAEDYNRRNGRQGAFWSDRYHATQIDGGDHLWACLTYIDLNMVRAGVVRHPREWPWTGWHELTGERARYRLLDQQALLHRLEGQHADSLQSAYRAAIDERIANDIGGLHREPQWTESIAVGSRAFVENVEAQLLADQVRTKTTRVQTSSGAWTLRDVPPPSAYSPDFRPVNAF